MFKDLMFFNVENQVFVAELKKQGLMNLYVCMHVFAQCKLDHQIGIIEASPKSHVTFNTFSMFILLDIDPFPFLARIGEKMLDAKYSSEPLPRSPVSVTLGCRKYHAE